MNHLLKKITFAGGKGSKPKPQPATLTPPKVGDISLASSYTYAETLDLISDGPIGGLVNKNGLILTDKDILQGIYLDNTVVAVSNDDIVLSESPYEARYFLRAYNSIDNFRQLIKNIQDLQLLVSSRVTPDRGFRSLCYVKSDSIWDTSPNISVLDDKDNLITKDTPFRRSTLDGESNLLTTANESLNTWTFEYESLTSKLKYYQKNFLNQYKLKQLKGVQDLADFYNNQTDKYGSISKFEKLYLIRMFNKRFGVGWESLDQGSLGLNFLDLNLTSSSSKIYYVLNATDLIRCESIQIAEDDLESIGNYSFRLEDLALSSIEGPNQGFQVYDFLLPRIDSTGKTTGSCIGLLIIAIDAQYKEKSADDNHYKNFAVSESALVRLSSVANLSLRKSVNIYDDNKSSVNQKYNFTNILAEYRSGKEYQSPFKYINHVLIDKSYGNQLYGPFRQSGPVQRIVENEAMLSKNQTRHFNLTVNRAAEGSQDGTSDATRASGGNFSNWNINQITFDEEAITQKHIIYNPNVSSVFITLSIGRLSDTLSKTISVYTKNASSASSIDAGTLFPTIVNIKVETGLINFKGEEELGLSREFSIVALVTSPTYVDIGNPDGANYSSNDYKFISEYGKTSNSEIFQPFVLPPVSNNISALDSNEKRYIKITKLSTESNSTLITKDISLGKVTEIIPLNFSYPFSAIVGTKIDSRSFSNIPTRTYDCKLKKVKVPSNYFPSFSNGKDKRYYNSKVNDYDKAPKSDKMIYDGDWDGRFKTDPETGGPLLEWTDNPAWILYDLLTNSRYGLGQYIDEGQIDIFDLYKIGRFCDAVDDYGYFVGVSDNAGGLEPRFSCNIYFQEGIKLFDAINTISNLFRGMIYYTNSEINFLDDRPKDPIALFTNVNVKDGTFNYTNYRRDEQFNSIEVIYIDRFENFQTKVEYIEDEEDIRKRGVFKKTINANGVTSKAMARRIGQHIIYQTIKENQSVSFTAGLESLLCKPGDLIIIEDELKSLKSNFGKVLDINLTKNSIRVNERFSETDYNNKITIYTPTGYQTREDVLDLNNKKRSRLDGFYLTQGGWSSSYNYLTGDYSFSRYSEGFSEEKALTFPDFQQEYPLYTGSSSKFCYFSTEFTGWVLGTGIPFKDDMSYSKFIMGDSLYDFDSVNKGNAYFYNTSINNRRSGEFKVAQNGNVNGANSKFRNINNQELNLFTQGLLDSEIQSTSPPQITTFGVAGIINHDYGSEIFVDQNDINASLLSFAKIGSPYRFQRKFADDQIYKVISMSENNPNEYLLVCNKYNVEKYKLIEDQQSIEDKFNTYSYTLAQKVNNTTYSVLRTPVITSLTTGIDAANNNAFYISGDWKPVSNAKGYNVRLYNPNNSFVEKNIDTSESNCVFYNEKSIGNYSFRVNALGSNSNNSDTDQQTYFDSDYHHSGIFIIYQDNNLLTYDRPYLSSMTIL